MTYVIKSLLALFAVVIIVPFFGPLLGLADFHKNTHHPGEATQIPNDTLNVYQTGSGRDVVLVHGQPGSAAMMAPLASTLESAGFRVTRYDRLGWGHSG